MEVSILWQPLPFSKTYDELKHIWNLNTKLIFVTSKAKAKLTSKQREEVVKLLQSEANKIGFT